MKRVPDALALLKGLEAVIVVFTAPNLLIGLSASKYYLAII